MTSILFYADLCNTTYFFINKLQLSFFDTESRTHICMDNVKGARHVVKSFEKSSSQARLKGPKWEQTEQTQLYISWWTIVIILFKNMPAVKQMIQTYLTNVSFLERGHVDCQIDLLSEIIRPCRLFQSSAAFFNTWLQFCYPGGSWSTTGSSAFCPSNSCNVSCLIRCPTYIYILQFARFQTTCVQ